MSSAASALVLSVAVNIGLLRHGHPVVRNQAGVKAPTLEHLPRSFLSRTRHASRASPRAPARTNAAAAQPPDPRRGIAPRHLAVVRRRPAKGHLFLCLVAFWSRSYRVKRRGGSPPGNLAVGEMRPSRLSFGANRRAPLGRSKTQWGFRPTRWATRGCGHKRSGRSRAAGHPGLSHMRACTALSRRRPHPDPVRRLRHRHARLPHGLQSAYSRLRGSHLSTKSRPAAS
jgi:hypothetical protein